MVILNSSSSSSNSAGAGSNAAGHNSHALSSVAAAAEDGSNVSHALSSVSAAAEAGSNVGRLVADKLFDVVEVTVDKVLDMLDALHVWPLLEFIYYAYLEVLQTCLIICVVFCLYYNFFLKVDESLRGDDMGSGGIHIPFGKPAIEISYKLTAEQPPGTEATPIYHLKERIKGV